MAIYGILNNTKMENKPKVFIPNLNETSNGGIPKFLEDIPLSDLCNHLKLDITLKFALNQNVYFMDNNKIVCGEIDSINIELGRYSKAPKCKYSVLVGNKPFYTYGENLFNTKELLLNSL